MYKKCGNTDDTITLFQRTSTQKRKNRYAICSSFCTLLQSLPCTLILLVRNQNKKFFYILSRIFRKHFFCSPCRLWDCLFFLILLIRIIYKYSVQEDLRQKRKATVLFPQKQYSSFSLYLFKAFRPKTSLFGEGMWESNPPRTLLTPYTSFED